MNPEQIKIIGAMVGTLIFAILIDSMGSGTSGSRKLASSDFGSSSAQSKSSSSKPSCKKKGLNCMGMFSLLIRFLI